MKIVGANMSYVISIVLLVVNSMLSYFKKQGKFFSFLLLLFMWILYWSNTSNPDYYNYLNMYKSIQLGAPVLNEIGFEFGYRALMRIAVYFGFSFEVYLAILTACAYLLIHNSVRKYCENYNYVYVLYFIFPFFLDVVQIRNFVAMSVFIFAVRYLIDDSKKSKFKYVALILVASTIHNILILYLPLILIKVNRENFLIRMIVLFSILASFIILANNKQIPYISFIVKLIFDNDKTMDWIDKKTNFGFLIFWFMQLISFLMALYARNFDRYHSESEHYDCGNISNKNQLVGAQKGSIFVELVYWINLLGFIYLPLYLLASTFTRFIRNILILNYISFAIANENFKSNKINLFNVNLFNICVLLYVLFFFTVELYIPYKYDVIDTILKNNIFVRM